MTIVLRNTKGSPLTFEELDANFTDLSTRAVGHRNIIVNGDMEIDQRNNGSTISATGFGPDRWKWFKTTAFNGTFSRSASSQYAASSDSFFNYSARVNITTGAVPAVNESNLIATGIEGFDTSHLGFATSVPSPITLSFLVVSSVVGTYAIKIGNGTATRSYIATYTVNQPNTVEYKTITIPGDTTGSWSIDNNLGILLAFDIGSGTNFRTTAGAWTAGNYTTAPGCTQLCATSGAFFYITGVQLEQGSVATKFEQVLLAGQLEKCLRYYEKSYNLVVNPGTVSEFGKQYYIAPTTAIRPSVSFSVRKRGQPTLTYYSPFSGASGNFRNESAGADQASQSVTVGETGFVAEKTTSGTAGNAYTFHWTADAELI